MRRSTFALVSTTALLAFGVLVCVLIPGCGKGQLAHRIDTPQMAEEMLRGRQVRIRVYPNWRENPCHYEMISAPMDGLSIDIAAVKDDIERISQAPLPDTDDARLGSVINTQVNLRVFQPIANHPTIAVLGSDQQDRAARAVLKDNVQFRWLYDDKPIPVWADLPADSAQQWWTFHDATGNPIKRASVEILLYNDYSGPRIWLGRQKLDNLGRVRCLKRMNPSTHFVFIVCHPAYGIASTMVGRPTYKPVPETPHILPLVHANSEARDHSLRGVVTDTRGTTVPHAALTYSSPRMGAILPYQFVGSVFTDKKGRFALYAPIQPDDKSQKPTIPPLDKYNILVEPPQALNLRRTIPEVYSAASPVTIILESVNTETHPRTLVFKDQQGIITDPEKLENITLSIVRRGVPTLRYSYEQWKDGCMLPLGQFRATMRLSGREQKFNVVDVYPDTPEEIVFETGRRTLYRGKVFNGLTGEPMPDTMVVAGACPIDTTGPIPQSRIDDLLSMAVRNDSQESSDERLGSNEARVTLTDANGCFEFGFLSGQSAGALSPFRAVRKDYVSFRLDRPLRPGDIDRGSVVELPAINMYPAATVVVQPDIPADNRAAKPQVHWKVDRSENQALFSQLLRYPDYRVTELSRSRTPQQIYVPAEVNLTLEFTLDRSKNVYVPVTFENMKLQKGQTLDLGRIDFKSTLRMAVQLQTSDGRPVQGKRLTCRTSDGQNYQIGPTDAEGIAHFNVSTNSTGELIYWIPGFYSYNLNPKLQWQVAGAEDQDKLFVFRLPKQEKSVFKGQVLDGITASPMPNMIVLAFRDGSSVGTGGLTRGQWDALQKLETPLDPNASALVPLIDIFDPVQITISDDSGRFQFALSTEEMGRTLSAGVIGENLIGTTYPIDNPSPDPLTRTLARAGNVETDADGSVILPALKVFPAGKITLQPNIPVPDLRERPRIRCYADISSNGIVSWAEQLKNSQLLREYELQANRPQVTCVPAGVEFDLNIHETMSGRWVPIQMSGLKLRQGQTLDLGELTFEPAMNIFVKVIDPSGEPVKGVSISLRTDCGFHPRRINRTDENGLTAVPMAPNCKATFSVLHYERTADNSRPKEHKESAEYPIGGSEDNNKVLLFKLSDEMVELLTQ